MGCGLGEEAGLGGGMEVWKGFKQESPAEIFILESPFRLCY